MKIKLLIFVLLACVVIGVGAGFLFNALRPVEVDLESVIGSFPKEGRLEILSAAVEINTSILKGEKNDADYFYVYSTPGTAVYSVDLSEIEIDYVENSKKVLIGIPTPDFSLYIDESDGETVYEYQKYSFSGSAQDGYESYINSRVVSYNDMVESMKDNRELMDMAKESAKTQVTNLTLAMIPNDFNVFTYFLD